MPELTFAPTVTYMQGPNGQVVQAQAQGAQAACPPPPAGAWTASTQAAVTRLLSFISNTQTMLHAAMGGQLSENQKAFMSQYQDHDLTSLQDLQVKYNHVLSHHGFKGREAATTIDEIKKAMKTDMAEIMVIDARAKTLQSLDKKD